MVRKRYHRHRLIPETLLPHSFLLAKKEGGNRTAGAVHVMVSLTGSAMAVYGILLMVALFLNNAVWRTDFQDWWPTISWIFLDWSMQHEDSIYCDVIISFGVGIVLLLASELLGSYHEFCFDPPDRYRRRQILGKIRFAT